MDISDIILFISTSSANCVPALKISRNNNLPIRVIRLDTKEARDRVKRGKYFKIQYVPTLLITYLDGNLQLFEGIKATQMLSSISEHNRKKNIPIPQTLPSMYEAPSNVLNEVGFVIDTIPSEGDEFVIKKPRKPRRKKSRKKTRKKGTNTSNISNISSIDSIEANLGGDGNMYDSVSNVNIAGDSNSSNLSSFDDDIEMIGGGLNNNSDVDGLRVGGVNVNKATMSDIASMAKQMEKARTATLGYDEKNLPKTSF